MSASESGLGGLDRSTLLVFAMLVVVGGSNAVVVRFSHEALPPFWGAASRFVLAALVFWSIVLIRRIEIPGGRGFYGTMLYGALGVGASFGFLYWGLLEVQAGLAMVIAATVPLLTLFFARLHRIEAFRWRALGGALFALAGIALAVSEQLGSTVPLASVLSLLAGSVCVAEATAYFKLLPKVHPIATNAIAVTTGALMLTAVSLIAGEQWVWPLNPEAAPAYLYLVLVGTVALFYMVLYVLNRWSASATSYSFLLFPISTVTIGVLVADEQVTLRFLIGGAIVMLGVWIGAFRASGGRTAVGPTAAD